MSEDPRCCGSGTCIIDNEGRCWCGQQWNGQKMCHVPLAPLQDAGPGADLEPGSATASDASPPAAR
jgi:hypothetical protein